jgi:hypothetical protein
VGLLILIICFLLGSAVWLKLILNPKLLVSLDKVRALSLRAAAAGSTHTAHARAAAPTDAAVRARVQGRQVRRRG